NELRHVRPGVERLDVPGDVDRPLRPAELADVLAEPELHRLGGDRLDLDRHLAPARIALDELPTDGPDGADADGQHDDVEVARDGEDLAAGLPAVPVGLEAAPFALEAGAVGELGPVGLRRPAGEPAHVDEGPVRLAVAGPRLDAEGQRLDV